MVGGQQGGPATEPGVSPQSPGSCPAPSPGPGPRPARLPARRALVAEPEQGSERAESSGRRRRPDGGPTVAAGAVAMGAWVGESLGAGSGLLLMLVGAALLAVGVRAALARLAPAVSNRPPPAQAVSGRGFARSFGWRAALLIGLAMLGAGLMQRALDGLEGPIARFAEERTEAVAALRLVEDPRPRFPGVPAGVRSLARLEAGSAQGSLVLLIAPRDSASRLGLLTAGEGLIARGSLRPLQGREAQFRWRHAAAVFEIDDILVRRPTRSLVLGLANGLRNLVVRGHDQLPDPERALVAGFVVGDDRDLPRPVAIDFRAAGLSHLLAVSGANVALALALAAPLLHRFELAGRFAGGLAVVGLFAAMTRFEPSVLRASVMASVALLAGYLGRPTSGLRMLGLAATALLLIDPFLIHSPGFALSCGASAGILLLAGPLAASLPGPSWLTAPLSVTAAAQIGVLPVSLPLFGGIPLVALPANLLAGPAAAAIGLLGLGAGLLAGLIATWSPSLALPLAWPAGALSAYVRTIAALAARVPLTLDTRRTLLIGAALTPLLLLQMRRQSGRRAPSVVSTSKGREHAA